METVGDPGTHGRSGYDAPSKLEVQTIAAAKGKLDGRAGRPDHDADGLRLEPLLLGVTTASMFSLTPAW